METTNQTLETIRQNPKGMLWTGIFMSIIGFLAILFPIVSTLAINYFVGGLLMFAGVFQLFSSFSVRKTGSFFGTLLLALLTLAAGTFMVFHPLAGAAALTLILGILFIIEGTLHVMLGFEVKPSQGWGWMLFSGIISLLLGFFVISGLAALSLVMLGIILGINFLSTGLAFIFLYSQLRKKVI